MPKSKKRKRTEAQIKSERTYRSRPDKCEYRRRINRAWVEIMDNLLNKLKRGDKISADIESNKDI
jgi:hypothetical protein